MTEAKAWNFEELENWKVKVGEFELEPWEFEIVLEQQENSNSQNETMESGFWTAVSISTELTPELIEEWLARDIVRQIQEARKEAKFEVDDRIQVSINWKNILKILENFKEYIENETLSSIIENIKIPNLEKEIEIEWNKIILKLKK
jgi:isoleucyl-tRNA synthetase